MTQWFLIDQHLTLCIPWQCFFSILVPFFLIKNGFSPLYSNTAPLTYSAITTVSLNTINTTAIKFREKQIFRVYFVTQKSWKQKQKSFMVDTKSVVQFINLIFQYSIFTASDRLAPWNQTHTRLSNMQYVYGGHGAEVWKTVRGRKNVMQQKERKEKTVV